MEIDHKPFEEAVITGINSLIFVYNIQLKNTLDQVDSTFQSIGKEVKEPCIVFDINETLRMTDVKSLGVVRSTSVKDIWPVVADMKIVSVEQKDVKFQGDQSVPCITGSLFMPNGELVLCDYKSSVKVLNADFTQKEQLKLSSYPWDLCLMDTGDIVISQPSAKALLFLKVVPKLQTGSSITLDQVCRGVAVKDGLIYVSFDNGEIRILDRTGQQQRNVYNGFNFQTPYCISVMPTGKLYVSEFTGNTIRVLKDCKEISNCSNAGIRGPMGVYIDEVENITVCEYSSHTLRVIDAKGQTSKVLLSGTDGLSQPRTVSVRPNDNTIIVGGNTHNLVVCKMVVS